MAKFIPFKIIHPRPDLAEKVCALPYDVMNREEAKKMAEGNPFSFLHISRSEIDLPESVDPYAPEVYEKAAKNLLSWLQEGLFIKEEKPCYMIYRQTMNGRNQTGIVGCISVDDYNNNIVRRHEVTRKEKELDRTNHFDICDANTEPVFLTYRSTQVLDYMVKEWTKDNDPLYDFTTGDGVGHTVWLMDDPAAVEVMDMSFEDVPLVYIADGHHRAASAAAVAKKRRENGTPKGDESYNFFMAVCFPEFDLEIMDYNRVVLDLNGLSEEQFWEAVKAAGFDVSKVKGSIRKPDEKHTFGVYIHGQWHILKAQKKILRGDVIADLDVSILQDKILDPILGIQDPRVDKRIDFVGGIRGLKELQRRVDSGSAAVAFALCPVSMDELLAVADAGQIMPPKSTWFEPKLGSGLFVHSLKD
jgi:uncharacterized protein (DUF1015 family)